MKNQLPTLDDMIFEQRNKLYGAYELRQTYGNSLRKATLYGVAAMLFVTGSSFVYFKNRPEKEIIVIYDGGGVVIPPPPKEEVVTPPPPPPIEETSPPVVEQKQYLPPVPIIDELVIEEIVPPKQSDLDGAQISNVNVKGNKSETLIFDVPPPTKVVIDEVLTKLTPAEDLPFTTVEMMPEFEGGVAEMYRWLGKNLNYPSAAVRAGIEGKVFVKFIVEKDGSISQLEVMKGIGFGCDEESLRVLKTMPKWAPGMQNGRPVRVYFTLPIAFRLQ